MSTDQEAKKRCQDIIDWKKKVEDEPKPPPIGAEEAPCLKAINDLLDNDEDVKKIYDQFGGPDCPMPAPLCKCCKKDRNGYYSAEEGAVVICWNNVKNDKKLIKEVLIHEGTHALQDCY